MGDRGQVRLRERAIRAWRKERPKRAAKLVKRAALMLKLREKLTEVLGDGLPVQVATDLRERPIATVEGLRFTLTDSHERGSRKLLLLDTCSRCEAETGLIIDSLADLGQLFEGLGNKIYLGCSECLGLTNDELKPSSLDKSRRVRTKYRTRS